MSHAPIPILDLSDETEQHWQEIQSAMAEVMLAGQFILGPAVESFEKKVAHYLGCRFAIGLNSGSDALLLGLRALEVGPGDEVITTPFTFIATAAAISRVGATPIFVDIDPHSLCIDPVAVQEAITPRTRAIIPVHLYGNSCDMDALMQISERHVIPLLEDTAQAFSGEYRGKKLGTIGKLGAFSFFPSKNLGAFGDAGMLVTDDEELAQKARMLRVHGAKKKYFNEELGYNSRLDAIQAAVLQVKLNYIDTSSAGRRRVAQRYHHAFQAVPEIQTIPEIRGAHHVWHQYTIQIQADREAIMHQLKEQGISSMIYYPVPCHRLPLYQDLELSLPIAEAAASTVLSLPIWPTFKEDQQDRVIETLCSALARSPRSHTKTIAA